MIPRVGDTPEPGRQYTTRPGAYAILPRGNRLLMTLQWTPEPEVQLPGGGIDLGESPLQALHREVLEETGWRISHPRHVGTFRRFAYMPEYDLWAEKICHVFVAHPAFAVGDITEPDHELFWSTPETGHALLYNDGDRMMLDRYLAGS